jgi:hypothetical protein
MLKEATDVVSFVTACRQHEIHRVLTWPRSSTEEIFLHRISVDSFVHQRTRMIAMCLRCTPRPVSRSMVLLENPKATAIHTSQRTKPLSLATRGVLSDLDMNRYIRSIVSCFLSWNSSNPQIHKSTNPRNPDRATMISKCQRCTDRGGPCNEGKLLCSPDVYISIKAYTLITLTRGLVRTRPCKRCVDAGERCEVSEGDIVWIENIMCRE